MGCRARGFRAQEEPLCQAGCAHGQACVLYRVPSCANGPASSPFTCDSAVPLPKEAKCTSLLVDFRFSHLAGGTLASIMAKGSAFSTGHCHEKTRHRPACSSGGDEGMRG